MAQAMTFKEAADNLSSDLGDKVTIKEVARRLGLTSKVVGRDNLPKSYDKVKALFVVDAPTDQPTIALTAKEMTDKMSAVFGVRLDVKQIGAAIGRPAIRNHEPVTESQDEVTEALITFMPLLKDFRSEMVEQDVSGGSTDLVVVEGLNTADEKIRALVQADVDMYQKFRAKQLKKPWRPKLRQNKRGTGFEYDSFIEGVVEYMSLDDYHKHYETNLQKSYPARKGMAVLKERMARAMLQMSAVPRSCVDCGDQMFDGDIDIDPKVNVVLMEHYFLPGTPGKTRDEVVGFTGYCGVCADVRRAVVDLIIETQGLKSDSPKVQAKRTAMYVDASVEIWERHCEARPYLKRGEVGKRLVKNTEGRK